ncbi:MAG: dihydroorotase [Ignavibacteriales bacterium]
MKRFLTSFDIEVARSEGRSELVVDHDTVVTSVAEETANRLGIALVHAGQVAAAPHVAAIVNPGSPGRASGGPVERLDGLDLLVRGGTVVIPGHGTLRADVAVRGGKIVAISSGLPLDLAAGAANVLDASGLYVLPGLIDPHIHLGIFGPLEEEAATESVSALIGGVTTVGCFFGGNESHLEKFASLRETIERYSAVDVVPHLVLGTERQLEEIPRYVDDLAVTSFKLYMCGVPGVVDEVDDAFMLEAMKRVAGASKPSVVCVHAENASLVRWFTRKIQESSSGAADLADWADTHPNIAEEEAVLRAAYLAEKSGTPVYFVHISTKEGVSAVRRLKKENRLLSAETTSAYLSMTRESEQGVVAKMLPPFREQESVDALWEGVGDGTLDTIGTDNVTMTLDVKNPQAGIWKAMPGFPALATHLPVVLHGGLSRGVSILRVAELMSRRPAEIFGLYPRKGSMMPGSDADLVLVDPSKEKVVDHRNLGSRGDFSLYEGKRLRGWPVATVKSGQIVVRDGKYAGSSGNGRLLRR